MRNWRVNCFLILVTLLLFTVLQVDLPSTVAGDNLIPTPWHRFRKPTSWEIVSRLPTAFRCSNSDVCESEGARDVNSSLPDSSGPPCPDYFSTIYDDLLPWKAKGVSKQMLNEAQKMAAFRVVIKGGKLYTELYYRCVQSRMMFTLWSFVMLLERFPHRIPDVDIMFNCQDRPVIRKNDYPHSLRPSLFGYCSTDKHLDIPFPDWTFWGWPETEIAPWEEEFDSIVAASRQLNWTDRKPTAYWKGTAVPHSGTTIRKRLLKCNSTSYADLYVQDWREESKSQFHDSKLSKQCDHRYKVYVEGYAWSVSLKYNMACGSTLLMVDTEYYDSFSRGLRSGIEYWPISRDKMCTCLETAIEWGNSHQKQAEEIGKKGQDFLQKQLSMDIVYDYMLHLLEEYSKLLKFKVKVPLQASLICRQAILCPANLSQKEMLERSSPPVATSNSCSMPAA